jgi:hypothetical protein
VVADQGEIEIMRMWETEDLRPGRVGEPWLNVLLTS